jgi:hypothetical protein
MQITIKPTEEFITVNGVHCRVWSGETDKGVKLVAYVAAVRVHKDEDYTEFERELSKLKVKWSLGSLSLHQDVD